MRDIVQLILRFSYHYSRILGVLNFEIDTKSGEARITRRATINAAVINTVMVCLLPLLSQSELLHLMWTNAGLLHEYVFLTVMGMRIICVLATLYSRWWQRQAFIRLINDLRRLAVEKPEVVQMWRCGVIMKFTSIFLTEIVQFLGNIIGLYSMLTLNVIVSLMLLYTVAALVNVIITHFYFSMLNIHLHYVLLKQDLRTVLSEMRCLENERSKANFMIKCCSLADRLEYIASRESKLLLLSKNIIRIFGLQGLCISTTSYITSIAVLYTTFNALNRHKETLWSSWFFLAIAFGIGTYFADLMITVRNIYAVLGDHAELVDLLQEYTTCAPGLDKRLEVVMESFQLQIKRETFKFTMLGMYTMSKQQTITMANSIITSSIVLIQYELKYAMEGPKIV